VQVRGRSVRLQNHWPNSRPLDQLGFAVLPILPCDAPFDLDPREVNHVACNFIPRYVVYGKDGFCKDNALRNLIVQQAKAKDQAKVDAELAAGRRTQALPFDAVLGGGRVDNVQDRRKVELALRDTASEVLKTVMLLMMPVNLTCDGRGFQEDDEFKTPIHYFGVMSDRFHQPAPSTSDVMPGLVNLDERMGHGGICKRQCEVLINVA
jgi:hypothetical protein